MDKAKSLAIQMRVQVLAANYVQKQIGAGMPDKGMPKARHVATVAHVVQAILAEHQYEATEEVALGKEQGEVLRAALSGSLLNASQFRQKLEDDLVLEKQESLSSQYVVEE
jgi:hypothetical protein